MSLSFKLFIKIGILSIFEWKLTCCTVLLNNPIKQPQAVKANIEQNWFERLQFCNWLSDKFPMRLRFWFCFQPSSDLYRCLGPRYRCPNSIFGHQLRSSQQQRVVHSQVSLYASTCAVCPTSSLAQNLFNNVLF